MPQIQFHNGKILFVDGQMAMDPSCCCAATCCVSPPTEMLFSPSDHYEDEGITGGFRSLGGTEGDCYKIRDGAPYTVVGGTFNETMLPETPCGAINNWQSTLPGTTTGYWKLEVRDFGEFYCNHFAGIPPFIPPADFGCCDNEGESVHLMLQLALQTIVNEEGEPECWYFAQVAWFTEGAPIQVCRYYAFVPEQSLNEMSPLSTCTEFVGGPFHLYLDPDNSTDTIPESPSEDCWGCNVTYDPLTSQIPSVGYSTV